MQQTPTLPLPIIPARSQRYEQALLAVTLTAMNAVEKAMAAKPAPAAPPADEEEIKFIDCATCGTSHYEDEGCAVCEACLRKMTIATTSDRDRRYCRSCMPNRPDPMRED